ncbi:hydrogenase maturation protease [Sinanaerobacter chloroacetimidivorans]|nr:hydrogenase maturation protease [Sinanaerobacter chloroacetimidivorans]
MDMLVLGIGNRLMMDDGIGIYLTEILESENKQENCRYVAGETDVNYCLEQIKGDEFLVILDSSCLGREPCSVSVVPIAELFDRGDLSLSLHEDDLIQAIVKGKKLHKDAYSSDGILIGVEACVIDYGIGLSEQMKEKFSEIVLQVKNIIQKILSEI